MAEYYALLARAISRLQANSEVTRREIYVKARNALIQQLKAISPPLSAAEISRQRLELEEAIRKIERELLAAQLAHATEAEITRNTERAMEEALAAPDPPPPPLRPRGEVPPTYARSERQREAPPQRPRATEPPPTYARSEAQREPMPPRGSATAAFQAARRRPAAPAEPFPDEQAFEQAAGASPPPPPAAAAGLAAARLSRPAAARPAPPPPPPRAAAPAAAFSEAEAEELAEETRRRPPRPGRGRAEAAPAAGRRRARRKGSSVGRVIMFLIVVGLAGGGYYAWLKREPLMDFFAERFGGGPAAEAGADVPVDGAVSDVRIVGPQPADAGVLTPVVEPPPLPPQAIFYEERPDGTGMPGVDAAVEWRLIPDPSGPIVRAVITVPSRGIQIELSIEENRNPAFAYSHEVDILVTIPPDFAGGGIASVTSLAVKSTEEGIGDILAGVSHSMPPEFFWIELAAESAQQNVTRLRTRSWFDLAITYTNGQRAVLTFEKGTAGELAFREALAAWAAN